VSQVYNRLQNQWDAFTLDSLEIPRSIFPAVVPCAARLGNAQPSILTKTGAAPFTVCSVGQHDTASAVAGVPALEKDFAYISSGTWSLVGIETDSMITSATAYRYNIANEGGVGNKNRFLINVMGLWLIQECARQYIDMGENLTYAELDAASLHTQPFRTLINPDDALFFQPGDMVGKIKRRCAAWGQPEPRTPAEMNRCIKESLALAYRAALEKIEEAAGITVECVYIIGGGCKSSLLNQFSASATGKRVLAGPEEAAAAGNLCTQWMAAGEIKGLGEARQILRVSLNLKEFLPENASIWDEAFGRFKGICGGK
jgi:rhamnulokinase